MIVIIIMIITIKQGYTIGNYLKKGTLCICHAIWSIAVDTVLNAGGESVF